MSVPIVCHTFLKKTLAPFNKARVKTLLACVDGLLRGNSLTLTSIGRHIPGNAHVRHKIKRVDRFLGNERVQAELNSYYEALAQQLTQLLPHCVIAVDWSGCCGQKYHLLRASLLYEGRSIPLLNWIVVSEEQETQHIHDAFLDQLHDMLKHKKHVLIITDGGFKTPWFNRVRSFGWDFIGRLRGRIFGKLDDSSWQTLPELGKSATQKPRLLGHGLLGKTVSGSCDGYFHLVKERSKKRSFKRGSKQPLYPDAQRQYRKAANEPWILFSSLNALPSKTITRFYGLRMQIEQNFRDDKSQRYGWGWRNAKTEGVHRIGVLCLIAALASTVLWLIGFAAEKQGLHLNYQANSTKNKRVLSFLTLAKNVLIQRLQRRNSISLNSALKQMALHYTDAVPWIVS